MKITIITLFPEMFESVFGSSILKRAQYDQKLIINIINLRDFGIGKHKIVDDKPYGGGVGMVLRVDVVAKAIIKAQEEEKGFVILMDPKGEKYSQKTAENLSKHSHIILVCGHYEGFDERIRDYIDMDISIGDYVLSGGEIASMVITESVARLVPGILSKEDATAFESFSEINGKRLLEHAHYTRPAEFEGKTVPDILISGHKQKIQDFRNAESEEITKVKRPDLLNND